MIQQEKCGCGNDEIRNIQQKCSLEAEKAFHCNQQQYYDKMSNAEFDLYQLSDINDSENKQE